MSDTETYSETYSRREAEALLGAAARGDQAADELTRAELAEAAAEAGINPGRLDAAIRARRLRGRRLGVAAIAIGAAALTGVLVLGSLRGAGSRESWAVGIHNEHRRHTFEVEVLVPCAEAREASRCADPPSSRVAARDYCRLTRSWLAPGAKLRLRVPDAPRGCGQVWVRAVDPARERVSALFTMPARIEIERSGRLDQKGPGSPNMHGAPGPDSDEVRDCPTNGGTR